MARESKYGEKTKMVNYRVPESKVSEINQIVKLKLNEYEKNALVGLEVQSSEICQTNETVEKKSNPADDTSKGLVSKTIEVNAFEYAKPILESDVLKDEQEIVDDKIEYEILESFPFGIEKFEDFGKNKAIYFYDPNYYTRVVNEKAKHISYDSAVNYLKSK